MMSEEERNSTSSVVQQKWNSLFLDLLSTMGSINPTIDDKSPFPAILSEEPRTVEVLIKNFQQILSSSRNTEAEIHLMLVDHLTVLGESLGNYLAKHLDPETFESVTYKINAATTHWFHTFLRLPRSTKGYYRGTSQRARLLLTKMALVRHFPNYASEGYLSFAPKIPVIFASRFWFWLEELRFDLGLPIKSIIIYKDYNHLTTLLSELPTEFYPFFLVASTGSFREDFRCDDIPKLMEIAEAHRLWFHIEGSLIYSLAATVAVPEKLSSIRTAIVQADSILFNSLSLLGYNDDNKCIPTVFYRNDRITQPPIVHSQIPKLPEINSSNAGNSSTNINKTTQFVQSGPLRPIDHGVLTLPLWFSFQYIGKDNLRNRIDKSLQLSMKLYSLLSAIPSISILTAPYSMVVVFQYIPLSTQKSSEQDDFPASFIEKVNQQLLHDVADSTSAIQLDLTLVPTSDRKHADHILFNPMFTLNVENIEANIVETFVSNLSLEIELIDATLKYKTCFKQYVWSNALKGLYAVDVPNFVGLGAVRYIPPLLLTGQLPIITDPPSPPPVPFGIGPKLEEEIDRLNILLANKLVVTQEKSIYQLSKDIEGHSCILLGVDTNPMVEDRCLEYIKEILGTAESVEKEFDFSKQVGKIIEIGIKEAEERLRYQTERIEAEQGIIRKIPIVGSVWNWWSPSSPTPFGNTFSLLTTKVSEPRMIRKPSNLGTYEPNQNLSSVIPQVPLSSSSDNPPAGTPPATPNQKQQHNNDPEQKSIPFSNKGVNEH